MKGAKVNLTVIPVYAPTLDTVKDVTTWHILGRFVLGSRCANDDRLVNFASTNHFVVSSTRFQNLRRHLVTWFSNDSRTRNQIDHVLIRSH